MIHTDVKMTTDRKLEVASVPLFPDVVLLTTVQFSLKIGVPGVIWKDPHEKTLTAMAPMGATPTQVLVR